MKPPIYTLRNVAHLYGGQPALKIDALSIEPSTIVGVMGPNGSGKTTLLNILSFVMAPSSGDVLFNGSQAGPFSSIIRSRVALLTQEPYLMKRSVYDNILYGLRVRKDIKNSRNRISEALSWVGLAAEDFAQRQWNALSGGEAQRVALAARLILKPDALMLDEPLASVDAVSVQLIKDAILTARRQWGTTLIIASHDRHWLYDICDTVHHLFKGHLLGRGGENILFGPWHPRSDGLWEKRLPGDQHLVVTKPPSPEAAAIIPSTDFSLIPPPLPSGEGAMSLSGTISRLAMENPTRKIVATIMVANLPLTVKLPGAQAQDHRYYPGQKVDVYYHPRGISWY